MLEELLDRFGEPPRRVQQLLTIAELKAFAHSAWLVSVEQKGNEYWFTMYEKARVKAARIPELLARFQWALTFKAEPVPCFVYRKRQTNKKERDEQILEQVRAIVEDIRGLREDPETETE